MFYANLVIIKHITNFYHLFEIFYYKYDFGSKN